MDEQNFVNFITKHLDEMISLFLTDKTTYQNDIISEEILQAFSFLFEGSVDNMHSVLPFNALLKHPIVQSKFVNLILRFLIYFLIILFNRMIL